MGRRLGYSVIAWDEVAEAGDIIGLIVIGDVTASEMTKRALRCFWLGDIRLDYVYLSLTNTRCSNKYTSGS